MNITCTCKRILTTILLICLFFSSIRVAFAAEEDLSSSTEKGVEIDNTSFQESSFKKWTTIADDEYPIDLDDIEWESFNNHIEMTTACDMPDEMVKQLSTEQLLKKALHYPLLCDMFAYDTIEQGLEALKLQSNIIRELSDRTDLSELVLDRYKETIITDSTGNCEDDFQSVSETILLEGFLEGLYTEERLSPKEEQLIKLAVNRVYKEKTNADLYNGVPEPFIDTDILLKKEDISNDTFTSLMKAPLSETYVKTPNGAKVKVIKNNYKGDAWANTLTNQYKKAYPLATLLRNADNRYNCHSYAWYKQKLGNTYWMNSPKKYVSDKSYKYVGKAVKTKGHKIVYKYQSGPQDNWLHSGIVYKENTVTSKWGQAPLMRHGVGYCPYYGQYNVIHTYRRNN